VAAGGTKRVLALGDYHCGHAAGLTPPDWQGCQPWLPAKLLDLQKQCWEFYAAKVKQMGSVDLLILNGDLIDGRGERSGSLEQIVVDRHEQCEMAIAAAKLVKAKKIVATYGTAYHTGQEEDYEKLIADRLGAVIGSHEWVDVNGVVFDCKHHLGSSAIPHGRHTAVAKDRLWNLLWSDIGEQPRGQVYLRSHVHYHQHCGGPGWLAMTLPALQAAATKYGGRRGADHRD